VKTSLLILCLLCLLTSSCGETSVVSPTPAISAPTKVEGVTPTVTFTALATDIVLPTQLPKIPTTSTPRAANQPGLISVFSGIEDTYYSKVTFSPDGKLIGQANFSVKLWDVSTQKLIREMKYPYSEWYYATNVLFSPDSSLIAASITDSLTHNGSPDAHLLVWDVSTGELLQDWSQEHATMSAYSGFNPKPTVYDIPVDAMVFFPSSTKLAYANGNGIEIKDARTGEKFTSWSLGDKMYASELSIRGDGEFLYILMKWYKDLTFPALYRWKFTGQIWHPATKSLRREIKFEEVKPGDAYMWLVDQYLLYENTIKGTLEASDLSMDKRKDFPYRIGWRFFNSDASLMLCVRDGEKVDIELWNTDTWRNIYTLKTNFNYSISSAAFSPDNSLLATDYHGQIYLWDIRSAIQP
jgi:WD40 repeat protein